MGTVVSKEATLKEVLAEVSLLDVGGILKQLLTLIMGWGVFLLIAFALESGASYAMPNLRVPNWLIWVLILWAWIFAVTETKSYHEWKFGWYFPRLPWWASLLLAAYVVGGFELNSAMTAVANGQLQKIAALAGIYLYAFPLFLFLSVIEVGHAKLMEKRESAASIKKSDDEG